jgi:hypothetical protein
MDEFKLIKSPLAPVFQRGEFGEGYFPEEGDLSGVLFKIGKV